MKTQFKKLTQGKSTSQQQMALLLVIMQRLKVFAYSQCLHRKGKTTSHLELTSVRNEKRNDRGKPSRDVDGLCKPFWESTKGFPPGKALLISKQVPSVVPSYPIMCLWYVWCSLTLLMAALWYHQDTRHTQLSRLLTSIFHSNIEGEHICGRSKSESRLSLQHKHCIIKYKWINGPGWDDGISRQNFPNRLSSLFDHDILIDVTNKHNFLWGWEQYIAFAFECVACVRVIYSRENTMTLIPTSLQYCDFYLLYCIFKWKWIQYWGHSKDLWRYFFPCTPIDNTNKIYTQNISS